MGFPEVIHRTAKHLVRTPSIQGLGSAIPDPDDESIVECHDGVRNGLQEGLLQRQEGMCRDGRDGTGASMRRSR